jgi:hypothetical protein
LLNAGSVSLIAGAAGQGGSSPGNAGANGISMAVMNY